MPLLEMRNLTKNFGGLTAVDNLNLEVAEGEILGLIGPNGAGKTTALNLITGFFKPSSGHIIYKGKNITGISTHRLVDLGIVRTFQATVLFKEATAHENVKLASHEATKPNLLAAVLNTRAYRDTEERANERAMKILELLKLAHVKNELAKNLPYGYQRTLGVAMALAAEPELLLLDEPVTGMNPTETSEMVKLIGDIGKNGVTIIMVEHNVRVVTELCSRVVVLNYGEKIAEGSPHEVVTNKDVVEAYLGAE